MMLSVLFTLGGLAMTAEAQEKKDPPKKAEKKGDERFTETVTVRPYTQKNWVNPKEGVAAYRGKIKFRAKAEEQDVFYLSVKTMPGSKCEPGSEITDADGNVYKVDAVIERPGNPHGGTMGFVVRPPAPKKGDKKPA